jgi:hypothetical protein
MISMIYFALNLGDRVEFYTEILMTAFSKWSHPNILKKVLGFKLYALLVLDLWILGAKNPHHLFTTG